MVQLLLAERVAIASTEPAQHLEASSTEIAQGSVPKEIAPVPPTPAQDLLQGIRIGWRDLAEETAQSIRRLSQATVEQALFDWAHIVADTK